MTKLKRKANDFAVDNNQVSAGVGALLKYVEKRGDQSSLISEPETVYLQVCMKQVPRVKNSKIIRCRLPHSVLLPTSEVCLFVRDLDRKNRDFGPSERHFQSLLDKSGVQGITKILPLKALKLEHQPFEAKRNLSNMFDKFLADANIVRLLPGFLGKNFYSRKKFPIQVDLDSKKLKIELENALLTSQCIVGGRGSSCRVSVGHSGMSPEQLTENVQAAVTKVSSCLPGRGANIRNLHLKTEKSLAVPIYVSVGGEADVKLPAMKKRKLIGEAEEVSTVIGAKVRVLPDGHIRLIPEGEEENPELRRKKYKSAKNKERQSAHRRAAEKKIKKEADAKAASKAKKQSGASTEKKAKKLQKKVVAKKEILKSKAQTLLGKSTKKQSQGSIKQPKVAKMSKKPAVKNGKSKVPAKGKSKN